MNASKLQSISFRQDLTRLSRYTTIAYMLATVVLCCAIFLSYSILKNNLVEQSRLLAFGNSATQLRSTIRESSLYLADLKQAREDAQPGSLLEFKISSLLDTSATHIQQLKQQTSTNLEKLDRYDYYSYFYEIFNSEPGNIWIKLDQYVARLKEISIQSDDASTGELWLPVEATAARNGSLAKTYEQAITRLQEIKAQRSNTLQSTHKKLVLVSLFLVLLEIVLIFLPLRLILNRVNQKLLKAHKKLDYQANYDAETGLLNETGVAKHLESADLTHDYNACVVVSITNTESIAQITGQAALETFFSQFVDKINLAFPKGKTVFRAGDNRFGILYHTNTNSPDNAIEVHEQLVKKQQVQNALVYPEITMGKDCGRVDSKNIDKKTLNALIASQTYDNLEKTLPAYCPSMLDSIENDNKKIEAIKEGLANNEFFPFYQIKVDGSSGLTTGMEALCRWVKPGGQIIPPFEFIPIAEKSGLISEITWAMLEKMADDHRSWYESGLRPGRIAFNAAEMLLREADFPQHITKIVENAGGGDCPFDLEITENVALSQKNEVITNNIDFVRKLGMRIALDDFGTGYGSLSSVVELNVDTIKVDKSFVSMMFENEDSKNIVLSIISLCKQLNKKSVVEGVETEQEWEVCRDAGCDEIQGFFFYKPEPFSDVTNSLVLEQQPSKAA